MIGELLNQKVTSHESGRYLNDEYVITVPEGVTSLHFDAQVDKAVWLTCMVYDEQKNLRAQLLRAGESGSILIHEQTDLSSPYTISGSIQSGKWVIDVTVLSRTEISTNESWCEITVRSNQGTRNEKEIDTLIWNDENETDFSLTSFDNHQVFQSEKKWYKGDFHTHTTYTDGEMSREENIEMTKKQCLDFFVATDHNIVPTSWFAKTDTLVIPGTEVTSTLGHFNIINPNTSPFVQNRVRDMYNEEGTNQIIAQDYGDALVSINHPFLKGCPWLYKDTDLKNIDTLEIINDPTYPDNLEAIEQALIAWDLLLNDGYQITGIGGSDSHLRPDDHYEGSTEPSLIGDPGTFVHCDRLTAHNIMDSVRKGYVTVSRGGFINITDGECLPGEKSLFQKGKIYASVDTNEDVYIEWIVDGETMKKENKSSDSYSFHFHENEYHWIRVDIRYPDGSLYGFTNPVYFGEKQPRMKTWNEILKQIDIKV